MPEVCVECAPGDGGDAAGEPARFGSPSHMREVVEVIDRWFGEGHRYFRVRTADGDVTILRYDERAARWEIHFLESASMRT